jgi:hypothetical protein
VAAAVTHHSSVHEHPGFERLLKTTAACGGMLSA